MIRYPDPNVGELISDLACEAAANDCIGYDQNERTTFWRRLSVSGYHPNQITEDCEADCSAGVAAIVKAAGYLLGNAAMKNVSEDCYTGNIRRALEAAGFQSYTDEKYLTSDAYLLPGDFLLREGWHICTNVTKGSEVEDDDTMVTEGIRNTVIGKTAVFYARATVDDLKLRLYPSTDAPLQKWDHFDKGNPLQVTAFDVSGQWALVQFCYGDYGSYGWVWRDYIERI